MHIRNHILLISKIITMEIKAADVMKLRKATNAGMMDCKNALQEAEGDFSKAVDIIRKKGLVIASKRADRDASEGCVLARTGDKRVALVSLNCETDFVSKNENFIGFTNKILDTALAQMPKDLAELLAIKLDGRTISDQVAEQTGVIGEKIELAFYGHIEAEDTVAYIHPGNMLATIVGFNKKADEQVKKDIAMQIAAMAPVSIDKSDVPEAVIAKELEIGREKAREEGKPENMLEKIAEGRLNKFFQDSTLLNQAFIKDAKQTVKAYIQSADKDLKVTSFVRFSLND
jgi:elongation factor Ts